MKRVVALSIVVATSLAGLAVAPGCAVHTRPSSLADAAAASSNDRAKISSQLSPSSFAAAEKARTDAEAAYGAGDESGAQILGEEAVALYDRAFVQARIVRAQQANDDAKKDLDQATQELARLKDDAAKMDAEVAALEAKIKVAKDAQPITSSGPADPQRERARLDAAKAILTEAKLLCVSARLVLPDAEGLKDADAAVADVDKTLSATTPHAVPIDAATRARAQCLAALTKARRTSQKDLAPDVSDALLGDLSREGSFSPVRDDRGVVVVLEDAFAGDKLSKSAAAKLDVLGKVAAAHADMPVLVVVHDADAGTDTKRDGARGDAAKQAIAKSRADKLEVALAGATKPLVDPKQKDRARNERLEIVFVATSG